MKSALSEISQKVRDVAALITAAGVIIAAVIGAVSWATKTITAKVDDRMTVMETSMAEIRRDTVRTQLLLLINDYPDNKHRILTVAKAYFHDLEGDWYVSGLFAEWAAEHDVDISGILSVQEIKKIKGELNENSD